MNTLESFFERCPSDKLAEALDQMECRVSVLHGRKFALKGHVGEINYNQLVHLVWEKTRRYREDGEALKTCLLEIDVKGEKELKKHPLARFFTLIKRLFIRSARKRELKEIGETGSGASNQPVFSEIIQKLSIERSQLKNRSRKIISIVILGAGPSGLMQVIIALARGNTVKVLEKRGENDEGRIHVVTITPEAKKILEDYGIYQYLIEKKVLGPPPQNGGFAFAIKIRDLEEAMKRVIMEMAPDEPIFSYNSRLEHVDKDSGNLIIKTASCAERVIKAPDYLIIAEGCHSETFTRIFGGRRIEALTTIIGIGGMFKDPLSINKSFMSLNEKNPLAQGLVLSTPGTLYAARFPTAEEKTVLNSSFSKEEKSEYIKKWLQLEFYEPSEERNGARIPFKVYQSPEDIVKVDQAYVRSSVSNFFCGIAGGRTLFFISGDTRLETDVTLGYGCNHAIESAGPLIDLFQKGLTPTQLLNTYASDSRDLAKRKLEKVCFIREGSLLPYDKKQFEYVIALLENESFIADHPEGILELRPNGIVMSEEERGGAVVKCTQKNKLQAVKELLADGPITTWHRGRAVGYASEIGNILLVKLLLENSSISEDDLVWAIKMATKKGHQEIVALLEGPRS